MCRELSCRERRDEDLSTEQLRQSHFVTREGVDLLRSLLTLDTKKRYKMIFVHYYKSAGSSSSLNIGSGIHDLCDI